MFRSSRRREFLKAGAALGLGSWIGLLAGARQAGAAGPQPATALGMTDPDQERKSGLRVYIMTDQEGVAGVLNSEDYAGPESRYYELAKELLTLEVNAAIEGFAAGGATEFLVADGHGHGSINIKLLDSRAQLARNWPRPPYPFSLDGGFDFAAWVGQHARSRSEYAHLAHTGSFSTFEATINGVPVGEFGQCAACASQLGVRVIFGSGDLAFTKEARALVPGITTVAVKRGTTPGTGDECDAKAYAKRNVAAIHFQPEKARMLIREGAERAIRRAKSDKSFGILAFKPPFEHVAIRRANEGQPKLIGRASHPTDVIALLNAPMKYEPLKE